MRFGVFEATLESGELYKRDRLVHVQQQPFEVLRTLLEHPGELVTRETLRKRLWPDGVTVAFEQSLNKSVTRLRDALDDTAANPRFIETLPKRGYRFIAPVEQIPAVEATAAPRWNSERAGHDDGRVHPAAAREPVAARAPDTNPPPSSTRGAAGTAPLLALVCLLLVAISHAGPMVRVEAGTGRVLPKPPATRSPIFAARDAYERGRVALARRSPDSLRLSVQHFERAVALSPRYAEAYVGLAESWSVLSSDGRIDPREAMPRARDAANRALTLNPDLAGAHASLGRIAMVFDWDWRTADTQFARALAIDSGNATTHQWHACFLSARERHDEAIAAARRAVAADPWSLNANTALGFVLYLARRYDDAASQLERTLELDPEFAQARDNLALVRVQQGRLDEARTGLERVVALTQSSPIAIAELAWVYGLSGATGHARQLAGQLDRLRTTTYVAPEALALAALGSNLPDQAIGWLQHAATMRGATLAHLAVDPAWDRLRSDQRFQRLVGTVGLD